MKQMQNMKT